MYGHLKTGIGNIVIHTKERVINNSEIIQIHNACIELVMIDTRSLTIYISQLDHHECLRKTKYQSLN